MGTKLLRSRSLRVPTLATRLRNRKAASRMLSAGRELYGSGGYGKTWLQEEELCTVTSHGADITWNTEMEGDTSIWFGCSAQELQKTTYTLCEKHHWAELKGLQPGKRYWYQTETRGVRGSLSCFRTLPVPMGKYLFSFGIFSDVHLGHGFSHNDPNEIYFGKLVEESEPLLCQSLQDARDRGMELAIFTGDLTDTASLGQLERLRDAILPQLAGIPYYLVPGNHDKYEEKAGGRGLGLEGFLNVLNAQERHYYQIKYKGYQFLLLDSARRDSDWGTIPQEELRWLRRTLESDYSPAYLFLHHTCNGPDVWFGIKNFLRFQNTIRPFPQVQACFSGHMHRSAVTLSRVMTGQRPYVEVPATVQFPCGYVLVRVYEGGFQYNVYRSKRLDLAERSRHKVLGGLKPFGAIYTWYSLGGLGDRNFTYFENTCQRVDQYELTVEAREEEINAFYELTQNRFGSSVAAAPGENIWKVIVGRFDSLQQAKDYRGYLEQEYGKRIKLSFDGNYELPHLSPIRTAASKTKPYQAVQNAIQRN